MIWRDLGYWLYLLTLMYAPFAYGCIPPWTVTGLEILLTLCFVAWLLRLIIEQRLPRLAWMTFAVFGFELLLGWWMTLNSSAVYDFAYNQFVPTDSLVEGLPGSVAENTSLEFMWPFTAIFGAFCIASDMARETLWRRRLFFTMALTGVLLAVFGIILKLGGEPLMTFFWPDDWISDSNFALFIYHGNAGAYLNLVWPIMLAFAWSALEKMEHRVSSQLYCLGWGLATCICWVGVLMNASKFALIVFCILLPIFLIMRGRVLFQRKVGLVSWQAGFFYALLAVVAVAIFIVFASASPMGTSIERLQSLEQNLATNTVQQRLLAYDAELTMLGDAGWHGFGPGTFRAEFPSYRGFLGERLIGFWYYAHNDYLETWIEWGWQGCLAWFFLVFGALIRGWWRFPDRQNFTSSEDRLLWFGACLSLTGVLLHSLIDFPLQIWSISLYVLTFVAIFWNTPAQRGKKNRTP